MTTFVHPAAALPQQQYAMAQPQYAMPMRQPQAQQQLPYAAGYGMPMGMGMAQVPAYGMPGQPVYINSLSQLPPGAMPVSQQMLAQALGQGQLGAQVVQPESGSPLTSMLKGAGIGAAAGAAFGIIPFLPLGLFSGALVGAGVGAALGLVAGVRKKKSEGEFHTMEQQQAQAAAQAQAQMVASTPPGARSAVAAEARPGGVVMGPEMRRKWAAKVRAERAAAAAAHK